MQGTNSEANGLFTASGVSAATHVGPVILTTVPGAAAKSHIRIGGTMTPTGTGAPGFSVRNSNFSRCGFYLWSNREVWWTSNVSIEGLLGTATAAPVFNVPVLLEAELIDGAIEIFLNGASVFTGTLPNCSFDGNGTVGIELHVGSSATWNDFYVTWYDDDLDGDGYCGGLDCSDPADLPGDCDDADAFSFPGAAESCNGLDDDCDALIDDADPGVLGQVTYYDDNDGDSFGDGSAATTTCNQPPGTVLNATDCDDSTANNYPGNAEICDGLDNNCLGGANFDAAGEVDADGDGVRSCVDCDDGDAANLPGSVEYCDGQDNDCDSAVDDADPSVVGRVTWYADTDGDGFGNAAATTLACTVPSGSVAVAGDCDDAAGWNFPGNPELCDGLDNNCVGGANFDVAGEVDGDGDSVPSCLDCDDGSASNTPGGSEICDGGDNDCDGLVDDADASVTGRPLWFTDTDGDGFGAGSGVASCLQPTGTSAANGDCNDAAAFNFPGNTELCDGLDNDCDGAPSFDLLGEADSDSDGILSCLDCDDNDPLNVPGGVEFCDGLDNDCDGFVDDADPGVVGRVWWYADDDGDGVGDGLTFQLACALPTGYVALAGDCDDAAAWNFPGNVEVCDGLDNDCTGTPSFDLAGEVDFDADGAPSCLDCDDADPANVPDGSEVCDGQDNDCDGQVDDADVSVTGRPTWYDDDDGDGYGDPGETTLACLQPPDSTDDATDCDDGEAEVHPDATEVCDGLDTDCDGAIPSDEADADSDGWMPCTGDCDDLVATTSPDAMELCGNDADDDCDGIVDEAFDEDLDGYLACDEDCDDEDAEVHPDAVERCNALDDNCDGVVDEGWLDGDGDGAICDDCDDEDPTSFPLGTEVCDGSDNDCDGVIPVEEADADGDASRICDGDCADDDARAYPSFFETCDDVTDRNCDGIPGDEYDTCDVAPECGCSTADATTPTPAREALLLCGLTVLGAGALRRRRG